MIKTFIFLFRYKILKDPIHLSYHTKEFFQLSKNTQRRVLDKYFDKLEDGHLIENYFDTKESRYYDHNQEITFFHCYYFDKKIIEYNIHNLKLMDKFKLSDEKIEYLIQYALELIQESNCKVDVNQLIHYSENLPLRLSQNYSFMKYLVELDCYHIKYLTYNELYPAKQRELIVEAIELAKKKDFDIKNFLKRDGMIPELLSTNIDFILYLIENDIENVKYLTEKILESQTVSGQEKIIKAILTSLDKNSLGIDYIQHNLILANFLNKNEEFITYMVGLDLEYIRYVDWHNIPDKVVTKIINYITTILSKTDTKFNIMNYPFHNLFFQNYQFMTYLIQKDFRWIAVTKVVSKEENDKLITLFFKEMEQKNYKFKLEDFLEDGHDINPNLVENKKMLHYLFINDVPIVQHIHFLNLKSTRTVVENLVNELEKTEPEYEFQNEEYLIQGKYPIPFSNSYRFMRYVIDKNFNHIAYMDTSLIDKRELKRIINYAFRMVYYIRGDNKKLNFDLKEAYFQNSDIIKEDYFQECLKSL